MNNNSTPTSPSPARPPSGIVAGGILVLIGLFLLAANLVKLPGAAYPMVLGLVFLAWGLFTRTSGLLVPGGILTGIFAGTALLEGPLVGLNDPARGGLFLEAFAGGWLLISLLTLYTEGPSKWWSWPLYPGVILALIGAALLAGEGGLKALEWLGYIWPVVLIGLGILIIVRRRK